MTETPEISTKRLNHGHHQIASALFVSSLIIGTAIVVSAELTKPERYEYHPGTSPSTYVIYDRDTGRATNAQFDSKDPLSAIKH